MSDALGNNGGRFYSSLVKPVLIDCSFVVDSSNGNGLGIRSLKGSGVRDVFMYTSASAGKGNSGILNPMAQNASKGYALIKYKNNYQRYIGGFNGFASPTTGGTLAINASALTVGNPYIIASVGAPALGAETIVPVADVGTNLKSTWFTLPDAYGNTFIIWFSVSGLGSAPKNVVGTLVQQSIATGATAAQVGAALVTTISNLPSGISGVNSFTAAGTTTVTVTNTKPGPFPGAPADGLIPTGFTFATTVSNTNMQNWNAVGVPVGVIPAPGVAFIATATGSSAGGASSGTVIAPGVSGIGSIEVIGDPNASIAPTSIGGSPHVGGFLLVQFLSPTSSSVTTAVPTTPANGTVVGLSFYLESSSVLIAGE